MSEPVEDPNLPATAEGEDFLAESEDTPDASAFDHLATNTDASSSEEGATVEAEEVQEAIGEDDVAVAE